MNRYLFVSLSQVASKEFKKMKKLLYILSLLTVMLMMDSCNKEEIIPYCQGDGEISDHRGIGDIDGPDGGIIDKDEDDDDMDEDDDTIIDVDEDDDDMDEDDDKAFEERDDEVEGAEGV